MNDNDQLLKQFKNILSEEIQSSEKRIKQEITQELRQIIHASEQRVKQELSQKIEDSQKDTIETLTDLMHSGYNLYEERIKTIEEHLELPPSH